MMDMKKIIVVGAILLFFGVTVAPSINLSVVKASQDDDLVEVTTQACGIKGYGNTTVKLTREQYQDLEQYLVEFRERLNQTATREEAVPIFKEAVVELDKYGLLPKGMSVEKAQKLVMGFEPTEKTQECIKKFLDRNPKGNSSNTLCLLAGFVDNALFWSFMMVASFPVLAFWILSYNYFPQDLLRLYATGFLIFMGLFVYGLWVKPFLLFSSIDFSPFSRGSIYSIGLSGLYKVKGEFDGNIFGFTGIRITLFNLDPSYVGPGAFFLGSALSISIETQEYGFEALT
jgi:hypothetical protein